MSPGSPDERPARRREAVRLWSVEAGFPTGLTSLPAAILAWRTRRRGLSFSILAAWGLMLLGTASWTARWTLIPFAVGWAWAHLSPMVLGALMARPRGRDRLGYYAAAAAPLVIAASTLVPSKTWGALLVVGSLLVSYGIGRALVSGAMAALPTLDDLQLLGTAWEMNVDAEGRWFRGWEGGRLSIDGLGVFTARLPLARSDLHIERGRGDSGDPVLDQLVCGSAPEEIDRALLLEVIHGLGARIDGPELVWEEEVDARRLRADPQSEADRLQAGVRKLTALQEALK